jgi:hypothetical protein
MTAYLPDVECKKCAPDEPNKCQWLYFAVNENEVIIHTDSGEEIHFKVICFCGYGS